LTTTGRLAFVSGWICPKCDRRFARTGQGHECAPAVTLEDYFSTGPVFERPIFDAVYAYVSTLGELYVEPVSVGVFIKKSGSWLELRPMTKWVALSFPLARALDHAKIARKPMDLGSRVIHVVNLKTPTDVDRNVCEWLAESYDFAT
jgi:Domain of unknown function (DUF5655)